MKSFNNVKGWAARQVRKAAKVATAVAAGSAVVVQSAHAALPTEAATAFTTLSGNVTDILAAVWPIAALATGGFVLLRLFKKGANRAV